MADHDTHDHTGIPGVGASTTVATDTIFDAKGDLAVGTGANTSAKLTVGANDTIPMADSGETTGIKWVAAGTPTDLAYDDVAAVGTGDTFARGDHRHGMPSAGGGEILDLTTAETDDTLVLAPDGAGGVEFRAEAGGGGGWTQVINQTGTSFASFTSISGTWASNGTIIQQTNTSGERSAYYNTKVPTSLILLECEVRWPTGSSSNTLIGMGIGTTSAPDTVVALRRAIDHIKVNRVGTAELQSLTGNGSRGDNIWYKIRFLFNDVSVSVWEDGTFIASALRLDRSANVQRSYVVLYCDSTNPGADFRNIKAWVPTLPA